MCAARARTGRFRRRTVGGVKSGAATVDEYVAGLEPDRAATIRAVLEAVREAMPPGYEEAVMFGMIGWGVPLERYPDAYNKQPLSYVALASQKRYCSLYLMGLYMEPERFEDFRARWAAPRALDMGKSCLRFRTVADLDLPLIAEVVAAVPVERLIAMAQMARPAR